MLFRSEQSEAYQASVLAPEVTTKLSIEAGATYGWDKYANKTLGIDRFGASAPGELVLENLGMTPENVTAEYLNLAK